MGFRKYLKIQRRSFQCFLRCAKEIYFISIIPFHFMWWLCLTHRIKCLYNWLVYLFILFLRNLSGKSLVAIFSSRVNIQLAAKIYCFLLWFNMNRNVLISNKLLSYLRSEEEHFRMRGEKMVSNQFRFEQISRSRSETNFVISRNKVVISRKCTLKQKRNWKCARGALGGGGGGTGEEKCFLFINPKK
jgi:hypothetical protein